MEKKEQLLKAAKSIIDWYDKDSTEHSTAEWEAAYADLKSAIRNIEQIPAGEVVTDDELSDIFNRYANKVDNREIVSMTITNFKKAVRSLSLSTRDKFAVGKRNEYYLGTCDICSSVTQVNYSVCDKCDKAELN